MISRRFNRSARGLLLALLAALSSGCSRPMSALTPDQCPSIQLAGVPERGEGSQSVTYRIRWQGADLDGSVSHFEYALDPPSQAQAAAGRETTWVRTDSREYTLEIRGTSAPLDKKAVREFHTFVVRAVNVRAEPASRYSEPLTISFDRFTVAPVVQILTPRPNALLEPVLNQPVDVRWQGQDLDGSPSTMPAYYKFKLFRPGDSPSIATWLANPDSLGRHYGPSGFAGWDSVGGGVEYLGIDAELPDALHLFVVVAFDVTGAYSPVFSLNTNMLRFRTAPAGGIPPTLFVGWSVGSGGAPPAPVLAPSPLRLDVPAGRVIDFLWYAVPPQGASIKGYRWTIESVDLGDDTRRDNEETDWFRWSMAGLHATTARVGPFAADETHTLCVEVTDNSGHRALTITRFHTFGAQLDQDLLIVDDTRLLPDQIAATSDPSGQRCLRPYASSSPWPAAAELDTFLYAVGGKPWRGIAANCPTPSNPPVLSTPGLFAGYRFDTLGTRLRFEDAVTATPISTLARYRNIVWLVDSPSAQLTSILDPIRPMTALRSMHRAGSTNVLQNYIAVGGRVWLVGSGGALASLIDEDRPGNNLPLGVVFGSAYGDLPSSNSIASQFHWKSELIVSRTTASIDRAPGVPHAALPAELRRRTPATDAIPASRSASATAAFYFTNLDVSYLSQPNSIIEDVDLSPGVVHEQGTLDTLYSLDGSGGGLHPAGNTSPRPIMTHYHGPSNAPTVLSGFNLWDLARPDATALVDYVLGDLWGLTRQGGAGLASLRAPGRLPGVTPAQAAARSRLPGALGRR